MWLDARAAILGLAPSLVSLPSIHKGRLGYVRSPPALAETERDLWGVFFGAIGALWGPDVAKNTPLYGTPRRDKYGTKPWRRIG